MITRYGYYLAATDTRIGDESFSRRAEQSWKEGAHASEPQRCEGVSLWADDSDNVTMARIVCNPSTGKYETTFTRSVDLSASAASRAGFELFPENLEPSPPIPLIWGFDTGTK